MTDLEELAGQFIAIAKLITLRQAVDAGIHEKIGWDAYALKEGADPNWPALPSWKAYEMEEHLIAKAREADELRAEVERLRGVLGEIAEPDFNCSRHQYAMAMQERARAALGEKQ